KPTLVSARIRRASGPRKARKDVILSRSAQSTGAPSRLNIATTPLIPSVSDRVGASLDQLMCVQLGDEFLEIAAQLRGLHFVLLQQLLVGRLNRAGLDQHVPHP